MDDSVAGDVGLAVETGAEGWHVGEGDPDAAPSSTWMSTLTGPVGVSGRTVVTGSVTATMPVSTSTVATPMVP